MIEVGIAMLQGARREHIISLQNAAQNLDIDVNIRQLRKSSDIDGINALILPGGESTAMKIASKNEDLFLRPLVTDSSAVRE